MNVKISFLGAARSVTGSRTLIEANGLRFLVDCGMYQERDLRVHNWERFPIPPASIDAVLLTHAHIDHCGLLPKFVKEGFSGRIYCTPPTAELAKIMLLDSARLQESDAEAKKKRHERAGRHGAHPEIPLYTEADVEATFPLFYPVPYKQHMQITKDAGFSFYDAGHVLGSAMIKINVMEQHEERSIVFSGDLGRWNRPILRDPTLFDEANYVVTESTYANRDTPDPDEMFDQFIKIIGSTINGGGNVIIPSFALERAQEVLYYLFKAYKQGKLPNVPVYLDSPMAVSVTDVFVKYAGYFDEEMQQLIRQRQSPFDFPGLHFVTDVKESQRIMNMDTPAIIIAGAGMCTGGRIKYHLTTNIARSESTILFVGYQAVGTLGRLIVDGAKQVRILGEYYPVKAQVEIMHGLSSHADSEQLLRWLYNLKTAPRQVFVNHGEEESAEYLAATLRKDKGWNVIVPNYMDEFKLD